MKPRSDPVPIPTLFVYGFQIEPQTKTDLTESLLSHFYDPT